MSTLRTIPTEESASRNIVLFIMARFIGLAFAMLFPFIAIGALVWFGVRELARMKVAEIIAAPLIGLAVIVLMPFIGIATLARFAIAAEMPRISTLGLVAT